jgi:hypothetical protein
MTIQISYPSTTTGLPSALKRHEIERIAARVREGLFGNVVRQPELAVLARRSENLVVNGRPVHLAWEFGEDVHDEEGRPVFGVCEHDPGQPGTVMISVNGKALQHAPEIQRSSAIHELAHAIFDMPAVLGTKTRRSYRTTTPPFAKPEKPVPFSWPEWRANAFMGAFLVPESRLGRMLAREAPHLGFDLRWGEAGGVSRPRIRAPRHDERLGILADQLAEVFGVTSLFVQVRLRKCGFIIGEN